MKMSSYRLLLATSLLILLSSCTGDEKPEATATRAPQGNAPRAPELEVFTIKTETFSETIKATGTIAAKQTSRIGPLVEGVLEKVFVRVGDRPRKGEPLFQMRIAEYQQAVDQAKAALQVANAELGLQVKKLTRAKQLRIDNLLSQDDLDLTETSVSVARARSNSAHAALASAVQRLKDTLVLAPFNGTVTGRFADEGVYMSNRFSMGGQSSVVELSEAEIVAGIMRVPEAQLAKLKLGQRAMVYPGELSVGFESEVFIINDRVDPNTRMAEFRLPVQNDDYKIKPGQFTYAEVFVPPRELIKVPRTAVLELDDGQMVLVKMGGTWVRTPIKAVAFNDEFLEVLQGLSVGQQIAFAAHKVKDLTTNMTASHVDR